MSPSGIRRVSCLVSVIGLLFCVFTAQSIVGGDSVESAMQASQVYNEWMLTALIFVVAPIIGHIWALTVEDN